MGQGEMCIFHAFPSSPINTSLDYISHERFARIQNVHFFAFLYFWEGYVAQISSRENVERRGKKEDIFTVQLGT